MVGEAARDLWRDTKAMMQQVLDQEWFKPKAVVGFWGASRDGDDIRLDTEDTFFTLRQQVIKNNQRANFALSDFVAEVGDHVGAFAVTSGPQVEEIAEAFEAGSR